MNFDQRIRTVVVVSGIVFFLVGVVMAIMGITAEGSIDLRSAVVSGSLKTGSVGLFISFFGFVMIMSSAISARAPKQSSLSAHGEPRSYTRTPLIAFLTSLIASIGTALIGMFVQEVGKVVFFVLAAACGGFTFLSLVALLTANDIEHQQGRK